MKNKYAELMQKASVALVHLPWTHRVKVSEELDIAAKEFEAAEPIEYIQASLLVASIALHDCDEKKMAQELAELADNLGVMFPHPPQPEATVPDAKDYFDWRGNYDEYNRGWNDCRDAMLGEKT